MGSSRVFAMNATTMAIRSRVDLGSVANGDFGQRMPRGIALRIVGAHGWARDLLRADGLGEKVGGLERTVTLASLLGGNSK